MAGRTKAWRIERKTVVGGDQMGNVHQRRAPMLVKAICWLASPAPILMTV